MLNAAPSREMCLARLALNLKSERYSQGVVETYPGAVKRFLDFLEKNGLSVVSVQRSDVKRYVNSLQMVKKRRGRATRELRKIHRAAIHMLLRLFHDRWPPTVAPATEQEIEQHQILEDYAAWMHEIRGLAAVTEHRNKKAARRFLSWLGERKTSVSAMHVSDLDAYVQARSTSIGRTSVRCWWDS